MLSVSKIALPAADCGESLVKNQNVSYWRFFYQNEDAKKTIGKFFEDAYLCNKVTKVESREDSGHTKNW